jgi:dihydrolipoamide dehydrogenase
VASGRIANTEGLNLEEIGVSLDSQGHIEVEGTFVTSKENIYAIGDCIDTSAFAHTAYKEAQIVAKNIINTAFDTNTHISPSTIFTTPQIASCGLKELGAKDQGMEVEIKKAYYKVNAKAKIHGDDSGFVKVVLCADTNVILGATIIGEGASEIIHELVFCVEKKLTMDELRDVIHAHPTLSEILSYL